MRVSNKGQRGARHVDYTPTAHGNARCFCATGRAGLDARAVELVQWQLKKKIGYLAYVVAGLKALAGAQ